MPQPDTTALRISFISNNDLLASSDHPHRDAVVVVGLAGGEAGGGDVPAEGDRVAESEHAQVILRRRARAVAGMDSGAAHLDSHDSQEVFQQGASIFNKIPLPWP